MQAVNVGRPAAPAKATNKFVSAVIILVILIVVALYLNNAYKASQPASLPKGTITISQSMLEEKYGLRVNLIAVTSAGGMIDLRLKMIDGEKAKSLLQDTKNFPSLFVPSTGEILKVSEYTISQEIKYVNGGNIFLLFPNAHNAFKPGDPVIVIFGDVSVEPIASK